MRHYPDLGSTSEWLCRVGNLIQPIRSINQVWVVTCHQNGISALVSQTSFSGETSGSVPKCRLFSQAIGWYIMHPSYETKQLSANLFQDRPGLRAASTDIVVLQDRNVYDTNPAMTCLICNRGCIILIWIRIF